MANIIIRIRFVGIVKLVNTFFDTAFFKLFPTSAETRIVPTRFWCQPFVFIDFALVLLILFEKGQR